MKNSTTLTITPRQALVSAHIAHMRKTSTMPDESLESIARNKTRNLKTKAGTITAILDYIKYLGGTPTRITGHTRRIATETGKHIFVTGTTRRGEADINIEYQGLSMKAEIIDAKAKATAAHQAGVTYQDGAIYIIAVSFDGFYKDFHAVLNTTPEKVA